MRLQTETRDNVLIIEAPAVDLDASNAEDFKSNAAYLVNGARHVVLDLQNVGFMDSAGLGAVISIFRKTKAEGGEFRVCNLSAEVGALFELVHMQRLFNIYQDKESAIAASA